MMVEFPCKKESIMKDKKKKTNSEKSCILKNQLCDERPYIVKGRSWGTCHLAMIFYFHHNMLFTTQWCLK